MSSESYQAITALGSCTLGLSVIAVALRFYSRKLQRVPLLADDWIMVPGLLCYAGTVAVVFYGIHRGIIGYPTPKNPMIVLANSPTKAKLDVAFNGVSIAALGFTKLSALYFYHRIFRVSSVEKIFRALIYTSVVVVILWVIAFELLSGLQCGTHFSALWTSKADYIKYCYKTSYPFLLGYTISDFLLDLWIICLPIPKIWAFKSSYSRRLGVIAVFLVALVSFGANIARLVIYVQTEQRQNEAPNSVSASDPQLVASQVYFFSVLEVGLACIAVNLPSLWYLASKITPEAALRSLRSIISLRSLRSTGSPSAVAKDTPHALNKTTYGGSSTSQAPISLTNLPADAHATYDVEAGGSQHAQESASATKTVS